MTIIAKEKLNEVDAELLTIYRKGDFPCSYDGEWPDGKFVVL